MFNKHNKTLLSYGRKQIFIALFLLLFFALSTTSYLILRPFVASTADTIAEQLILRINNSALTNKNDKPPLNSPLNLPLNLINPQKYKTLRDTNTSLEKIAFLPVIYLIKENLQAHFKQKVALVLIAEQPGFYWFQLTDKTKPKATKKIITVGFSTNLIGTRPELTLLFLLLFLTVLAIIFSLIISNRLNSPLLVLESVIEKLAQGDFSARLPHHELSEINRTFSQINKLSDDFKNMLEQRLVFLAGISHDIRTPLTRLKLLLAIHEQSLSNNFIEPANKALNEIEALVKIYLDTGQLLVDEHIESVEIISFIQEILSNFSIEHTEKIVLTADIKNLQAINTQALKRVLTNFISNAIKYAPPSKYGDINIQVAQSFTHNKHNASLTITISDNGTGVEQAQLVEIYKPFYQGSPSSTVVESSGLGLSICRQICLSQGWSLNIENKEAPEIGLVVKLTLSHTSLTTHA